jgi:hypothetical protein
MPRKDKADKRKELKLNRSVGADTGCSSSGLGSVGMADLGL